MTARRRHEDEMLEALKEVWTGCDIRLCLPAAIVCIAIFLYF